MAEHGFELVPTTVGRRETGYDLKRSFLIFGVNKVVWFEIIRSRLPLVGSF